jgi:hypothetical protein
MLTITPRNPYLRHRIIASIKILNTALLNSTGKKYIKLTYTDVDAIHSYLADLEHRLSILNANVDENP